MAKDDLADKLLSDLETCPKDDRLPIFTKLAALFDPIQQARQYELLAVRIATRIPDIIQFCQSIVPDHDHPTDLRVFAAVTGASACRRSRRRLEGQDLLRHVKDLEHQYPILLHMSALTYRTGDAPELRRGSRAAELAYARLPGNPGVAHSLAAFLTDIAYLQEDTEADREMLDRALRLVNEAINNEPRGRFYFTRARINRKLGRFNDAKSDLESAIDLEDWAATDYRHRVTEYMLENSLVDADRTTQHFLKQTTAALDNSEARIAELDMRVIEANRTFGSAQVQVISTLAFFASALGLIQFTALVLGKGYKLAQALTLVAALGAILFGGVLVGSWVLSRGIRSLPAQDDRKPRTTR